MTLTRKAMPRRTFLRGLTTTLALPLLDAMMPAFATARELAAQRTPRLTFIYVPNGIMMDQWTPAVEGSGFEFTPILQPLAPFRDRLLILSGLAHNEARGLVGEAGGDHARASSSFLTGVHIKKTEGADLQAGISVDQIAARELGKHTQLASLELALDSTETLGSCEPGYSCAYSNTLSWRTPTTPMPMENRPRAVFEALFGDSDTTSAEERRARIQTDRSILDFVMRDASSLMAGLGPGDRGKITEYLEAIRDVERRIQVAEQQSSRELPVVERPVAGVPQTFKDHARLMYDLQVLAYQCDLTRITTFMVGHEQTTRSYTEIGISDAHHPLTHHGGDPDKIDKVGKINSYHVEMLAYFVEKLRSAKEPEGSLLDNSIVVYGSGLSDGNMHRHDNLPMVILGGGAGQIKGGRHIRYPENTPMPNLYATLLRMLDVPVGDVASNGSKLEPLRLT